MTKIAFVGCGYVFDHYMSTCMRHTDLAVVGITDIDHVRLSHVGEYYSLATFASLEELIQRTQPDIIVNLTSIEAHYTVVRQSLESGCHVYSEKPLSLSLDSTRLLFALAEERHLHLSVAPCNVFSETIQTIWKAIRLGGIGAPCLAYAEFDDNPIYLMNPEGWRSKSGAPWPYVHEYEVGCTIEHAGYHLTWLLAIFGPVTSVTAFSQTVIKEKDSTYPESSFAADFSVGCLQFESGFVARLTCSIAAPSDHQIRIFGTEGVISTDTYRHYQSPVFLERFSKLTLNLRKSVTIRRHKWLASIFGVGGRSIELGSPYKSATSGRNGVSKNGSVFRRFIDRIKLREVGAQDKMLGVSVMADALRNNRPQPLSPEFHIHVTELTLAIQNAGTFGRSYSMTSTFSPLHFVVDEGAPAKLSLASGRSFISPLVDRLLDKLHKH